MKIKICGLTSIKDIDCVNMYKPDYIGFVFYKNSKRYIPFDTAKELKERLDSDIKVVGVFVNAPIEEIIYLCNSNIIDVIQLHGDEDNEYIARLKLRTSTPTIKALRVKSCSQIIEATKYGVNYLLLDTYIKDTYGGSGNTFDRTLIPSGINNYFLAGGLNITNIQSALTDCSPYCVDISSGVETDGHKDPEKVKQIIALIRRYNNEWRLV